MGRITYQEMTTRHGGNWAFDLLLTVETVAGIKTASPFESEEMRFQKALDILIATDFAKASPCP